MLEQIREIIAENLAIDVEKVTESADFKEDLDADSLDLFEMVTALEDEYEIEIPEEDLPTLKTVGDVVTSRNKIPNHPRRYGMGS